MSTACNQKTDTFRSISLQTVILERFLLNRGVFGSMGGWRGKYLLSSSKLFDQLHCSNRVLLTLSLLIFTKASALCFYVVTKFSVNPIIPIIHSRGYTSYYIIVIEQHKRQKEKCDQGTKQIQIASFSFRPHFKVSSDTERASEQTPRPSLLCYESGGRPLCNWHMRNSP